MVICLSALSPLILDPGNVRMWTSAKAGSVRRAGVVIECQEHPGAWLIESIKDQDKRYTEARKDRQAG